MTARERIRKVIDDYIYADGMTEHLSVVHRARLTDSILRLLKDLAPGMCEVCDECGGCGWYAYQDMLTELEQRQCEPCLGTGIRIKQDRQEEEA